MRKTLTSVWAGWLMAGVLSPSGWAQEDAPAPRVAARSVVQPAALVDETDAEFAGNLTEAEAFVAAEPTASATAAAKTAPKCDAKKKAELKKAVATAYAPLFYDNKFGYLCDDCYDDWHLGECWKRRSLGDCLIFDVGGQYRARYHHEQNHRGLGLTGRDDDFLLHRTRLYGNLQYGDRVRVYAEGIDAESNYENFAPRGIEVNRADLLNLFADVKLLDGDDGDLWARVGRQELLYGNQRLVSPLDWGNTRRSFEGYKLMWKGTEWDADAFYVRPIFPKAHDLDGPDQSQEFMGLHTTYKKVKDHAVDFYYFRYNENDAPVEFQFNTLGTRWQGKEAGGWLWEIEAAYQYGDVGAADNSAGFYTLGLGKEWADHCWKPTAWVYYDWASGDDTLGTGFHHLFPLGHKYMGFMDLFGRRNLEDLNFLVTATPREKLKLTAWWHIFHLQNRNDVPYSIQMTPLATLPGGSQDLGQELDLLLEWNLTPRTQLAFGYSHFWRGDFWGTNPSPNLVDLDADFFYTAFTVNF